MKFDKSLEQAMEMLNLKNGFTEKEFKSNYKNLMRGIHPDALGNLNPIARKILEDEAKRANIAKQVIESYLSGNYPDYNRNKKGYHRGGNSNNTAQEQQRRESEYRDFQEQQRRKREYRERLELQRREREYLEQQEQERKERELRVQQIKLKENILFSLCLSIFLLITIPLLFI